MSNTTISNKKTHQSQQKSHTTQTGNKKGDVNVVGEGINQIRRVLNMTQSEFAKWLSTGNVIDSIRGWTIQKESNVKITGKDTVRIRVGQKMTQPEFAKYLSKLTSEVIDSSTVGEIEDLGVRDAWDAFWTTQRTIQKESNVKITGKDIRKIRLGLSMTQPEFAKWLQMATGELIDSIRVCRMENFGSRGACHALPPSNAVREFLERCILLDREFYEFLERCFLLDSENFPEDSIKYVKRNYYIRGHLHEVEQIAGVKAVKISSSNDVNIVSEINVDRLQVSEKHLKVFQDSGWMFIENSVSSHGYHEISNNGTVFRRLDEGTLMIGTNELTVKLNPEIPEPDAERRLEREEGLSSKRRLKFAPNLFVVKLSEDTDSLRIANRLQEDKDFVYAEPVMLEYISHRERVPSYPIPPEDPLYPKQWQWRNDGVNGTIENADIRAELAWRHSSGRNTRIAIIDRGFDVHHEDLSDAIAPESGYFDDAGSFVLGLANYPNHAHGTFCAGLAGARANNEVGGCGIAFESDLLLVSYKDKKNPKDEIASQKILAEAIGYAVRPSTLIQGANTSGADVISCSLGANWDDNNPNSCTVYLTSMLNEAIDFAGREGRNGLGTPIFWATSNNNVPIVDDKICSHADVIAVGRSNSSDLADGSAFGPELDFIAPGVKVFSTWPGNYYGDNSGECGVDSAGTSFATPIAAGVAALLLSVRPDLTSAKVREIMRDSCDQVGGVDYINGHNNFYGYGRINAARAINQILLPNRTSLSNLSFCLMSSVIMMCFTMVAIS
jgi:subtilisin family serine protease/DNA-binding transcriptional regulator YiaG